MIEIEFRQAAVAGVPAGPWTAGPTAEEGREVFIAGLVEGVLYDVRARIVAPGGTRGEWFQTTQATKASRGENVDSFGEAVIVPPPRNVRIEGDDCVTWDPAPIPDARYEVLHAAGDFPFPGAAIPASSGLVASGPIQLCSVPRGERTIMVRTVLPNGEKSAAAVLLVDRGAYNERLEMPIQTGAEHPGWAGDTEGATLSAGSLVQDLEDVFFGDPGGPFFGAGVDTFFRNHGVRATYEFTVTPAGAASPWDGRMLTVDVDTTAENWRLEYRPAAFVDEFFGPGSDPFFGEGSAPFFDDGWKPWPGRIAVRTTDAIALRVVIPAGCRIPGSLNGITWNISRPPTYADATAAIASAVAPLAPLRPPMNVVSADQLLVAGSAIVFDSSGGIRTGTLPSSPLDGDSILVKRVGGNNVILDRNGKDINGAAADFVITPDGASVELRYHFATGSWWTWQ